MAKLLCIYLGLQAALVRGSLAESGACSDGGECRATGGDAAGLGDDTAALLQSRSLAERRAIASLGRWLAEEGREEGLEEPPQGESPYAGTCGVGDHVACPGTPGLNCAGNQCCPGIRQTNGTFPCPSADAGWNDCEDKRGKAVDCSASPLLHDVPPPVPFDNDAAKVFANLANAAYCGPNEDLKSWTCDACTRSGLSHLTPKFVHHTIPSGIFPDSWYANSTFAYVAKLQGPAPFSDGCLVSFRGSTVTGDFLDDVDWTTVSPPDSWACPGCNVMNGVYLTWDGIEKQVIDALADVGCTPGVGGGLFITGHSLGASVATLATYALKKAHGFDISMAYTFEGMRVGNMAFANTFDDEVSQQVPFFRITHRRDFAVHIPPSICLLGNCNWYHVQYEVWYDTDEWKGTGNAEDYTVCNKPEDPKCANQFGWNPLAYTPYDHCTTPLTGTGCMCNCANWVALSLLDQQRLETCPTNYSSHAV